MRKLIQYRQLKEKKVIKEAEPLLQEILYNHDKVLAAIKVIPHEELVDVLQQVKSLSFFKKINNGEMLALLINAMRKVPQDERPEFVANLEPLLEGILVIDEYVDIFDAMKETPRAELNDFWQKVAPFLQEVKFRRIDVIKKIKEIWLSDRPAF